MLGSQLVTFLKLNSSFGVGLGWLLGEFGEGLAKVGAGIVKVSEGLGANWEEHGQLLEGFLKMHPLTSLDMVPPAALVAKNWKFEGGGVRMRVRFKLDLTSDWFGKNLRFGQDFYTVSLGFSRHGPAECAKRSAAHRRCAGRAGSELQGLGQLCFSKLLPISPTS